MKTKINDVEVFENENSKQGKVTELYDANEIMLARMDYRDKEEMKVMRMNPESKTDLCLYANKYKGTDIDVFG